MTERWGVGAPGGRLTPFTDAGELRVIVETAKGMRNKYAYDEELGLFELSGILPAGAVFP